MMHNVGLNITHFTRNAWFGMEPSHVLHGRVFHGPATVEKPVWLATDESLTGGTSRRLVPAERNVGQPSRSSTGTSGPKYRSALRGRTIQKPN